MRNCSAVVLPYWQERQTGYFVINTVIIPPLGGAIVLGSLLNIVVFNSAYMRRQVKNFYSAKCVSHIETPCCLSMVY